MSFSVASILAYVLGIVGTALILPLAASLHYDESLRQIVAFAGPLVFSWAAAAIAFGYRRRGRDASLATGSAFILVGCVWVAIGLFGALPLWIGGAFPNFIDAVFESVSGFTTTGASVAPEVESLPRSVNLWRCETHWLGGMGVIALAVALMPLLGVGGFRLFKAETTGPEKGKVTSRITDTAKALWLIYFLMTATEAVLLHFAGLSWYDAVCHSFSTLGTGGFSTRNGSVRDFDIAAVDWICIVFMFLASVNFALYFRLFTGRAAELLKDTELKALARIVVVAVVIVTLVEMRDFGSFARSLRYSAFQVAAIVSTTGFSTSDYAKWRPAAQLILFALFWVGGCSGSTAGGIKVIRWTVLAKQLRNEFSRLIHPHEVTTIRINGIPGREEFVPLVAAFIFTYVLLVFATALASAFSGFGLVESLSAALSMVGNIGPAFGKLGPTANYGSLPAALKVWYSFAMLAGRLEIYTMLILALRGLSLCKQPVAHRVQR